MEGKSGHGGLIVREGLEEAAREATASLARAAWVHALIVSEEASELSELPAQPEGLCAPSGRWCHPIDPPSQLLRDIAYVGEMHAHAEVGALVLQEQWETLFQCLGEAPPPGGVEL
eukprot:CAMPEP_0206213756 /NCGR_PEP_ID=MMETSP0047_2-20121206/1291_1 /ASSEMBLY_ACC=CAM_ASM_000192 /TAXON_ID=195065 /ORGANISM="Chroomonas mesostigmatica_cf, Strain CCMP1168" /LENGTH=115 /DNA_ID=CAMNT_0053635925 /DNA_START=99 /DNA_END=446 /DNA_ORIENTATION=+